MFLRKKVKWHIWRLPAGDLHKLGIYIEWHLAMPPPPCLIHSFMCFFFSLRKKHTTGQRGVISWMAHSFCIKWRCPVWTSIWVQKLSHSTLSNLSSCLSMEFNKPKMGRWIYNVMLFSAELNCQFIQRRHYKYYSF